MRVLPESLPVQITAIICAALLLPGESIVHAQPGPAAQPAETAPQDAPLTAGALNSLVAPIALYPDPLLAQVLAASTYPLEVVEASRWLKQNGSLQGQALVEAAAKQNWDPSVQALVMFPSVLSQMDQNIDWVTALGNAFLSQQQDVMTSIQHQRQTAYSAGLLQSNSQQKVGVEQVDGSQAIAIQPANPNVIYAPSYNPEAVFGAAPDYYPYPALYYPPAPTGAVIASNALLFGSGFLIGSAFGGWNGGWGWGMNWGPRPAVYVNNNFINRYNPRATPYRGMTGTGPWNHNPSYRGGVPYPNAAVGKRYGQTVTNPARPVGRGAIPGATAPGAAIGRGNAPGVRPGTTPAPAARPAAPAPTPGAAVGRGPIPNVKPPAPAPGLAGRGTAPTVRPQTPAAPTVTPRGQAARTAPAAPTFSAPRPNPSGGANRMAIPRGNPGMRAPRGGGGRRR